MTDRVFDALCAEVSRRLTRRYSTSFSLGIRLFGPKLRQPVYDIYGLVRLADEIVDSWHWLDQPFELSRLEADVERAIACGAGVNPVVHAYARTAHAFDFDPAWTQAFFASMAMDLKPDPVVTDADLTRYVYGSAEVIGLMCLAVFVGRENAAFARLAPGAQALGRAYQHVNFLRDLAADREGLRRTYFPAARSGLTGPVRDRITRGIRADLLAAQMAVAQLPASSRRGVALSLRLYGRLLEKLERAPVCDIAASRIRVPAGEKLWLLVQTLVHGQ